jgi:cellulose synthase/poly-beta-1,6-N-acetylglucosamine synthase-like glycosyltransferase
VSVSARGGTTREQLVVVYGLDSRGLRRVLAFELTPEDGDAAWRELLSSLVARGLDRVRLVVSDAHPGLAAQVADVLGARWQRDLDAFVREAGDESPRAGEEAAEIVQRIAAAHDRDEAMAQLLAAAQDVRGETPRLSRALGESAESLVAFHAVPARLRESVRSTRPFQRTSRRLERELGAQPRARAALLRTAAEILAEQDSRWEHGRRSAPLSALGPVEPKVAVPHYVSGDSAPAGFATRRAVWIAPAFIAALVLLAAAIVPALPRLTDAYAGLISRLTGVPREQLLPPGASLGFRPFLALLLVLLGVFAVGSARDRTRAVATGLPLYLAGILVLDVTLALAHGRWESGPFTPLGGVAAGLAGFVVLACVIFACYSLPAGVRVERSLPAAGRIPSTLAVAVAVALAAAVLVAAVRAVSDFHPSFPLVGSLGSVFVVFALALSAALYVAGWRQRQRKPASWPAASVAFLVPAFNEEHEIEATVAAIDAASEGYRGACTVYIVDNGSSDGTRAAAERALAACRSVTGRVLTCPTPGKAHALNFGLAHIGEEVVVRIDADTLVAPDLLDQMLPWFADPRVGGVSGLPLPKDDAPRWLHPMRLIEVYYGAAYMRVVQGAVDAVMVMPGLIAGYRRAILDELGGFGVGFNGEDADVTVRIGRLGYRIVTDAGIHVFTEVPKTLPQLREQRQRWARGTFHMAGRNLSSVWMRQGLRGVWMLPLSILNAARRSLLVPLLLVAAVVELLDPAVFSFRAVTMVAGFLLGLQLLVTAVVLAGNRQFSVLPYVPAYLLFRLLRAYIAFEALLTLRLRPSRARVAAQAPVSRRAQAVRLPRLAVAGVAALDVRTVIRRAGIGGTGATLAAAFGLVTVTLVGSQHLPFSARGAHRHTSQAAAAALRRPAGSLSLDASLGVPAPLLPLPARSCRLDVPASWHVVSVDAPVAASWRSTADALAAPLARITCDVPRQRRSAYRTLARARALHRTRPGYHERAFRRTFVAGRRAWLWEYDAEFGSTAVRVRAVAFRYGTVLATQAPERAWPAIWSTFAAALRSYRGVDRHWAGSRAPRTG